MNPTTPLVLAVVLAVAACSTPDRQTGTPAAPPPATGPGVVSGTAPRGSIVALVPAGAEAPMPEGPAVMDQYSKTFVPNVLYVRVGDRKSVV